MIALALALQGAGAFAQEPRIADNSFLVEEAYNQEAGVVQHISTCQASGSGRRDLSCTFTQEWPVPGMQHQFSYTVPVFARGQAAGGVGDVLLNYRYQWTSGPRVAVSPRLSVILPTGSFDDGRGSGSAGAQVNLPVSVRLGRQVAAHLNAGATWVPRARVPGGGHKALTSVAAAASLIGPLLANAQLMVEMVAMRDATLGAGGTVTHATDVVFNPGARFAIQAGTVQIVPGFSVPLHLNDAGTPTDLFFYLSFEHAFRSVR